MSTILRALRRLEQEKSAGLDRSLGEAVANAPRPPPKRSSLRWIAEDALDAKTLAAVVDEVMASELRLASFATDGASESVRSVNRLLGRG